MSKSLAIRDKRNRLIASQSYSGAAGKTMVAAGGGGLTLSVIAGMLPLVTLPILCIILIVAGIFMWE